MEWNTSIQAPKPTDFQFFANVFSKSSRRWEIEIAFNVNEWNVWIIKQILTFKSNNVRFALLEGSFSSSAVQHGVPEAVIESLSQIEQGMLIKYHSVVALITNLKTFALQLSN